MQPGVASCQRCGLVLAWLRSREWVPDVHVPRLALGRACPACARGTRRRRSPVWLKPWRTLSLERCSWRQCDTCGWEGAAIHGRRGTRRRTMSRGFAEAE